MTERSPLDDVLEQVADHVPVDWSALEARPMTSEARGQLELLRLLEQVADANRRLQSGEFDDDSHTAPRPAPPSISDAPLQQWGRYRLDDVIGRGGFGSVHRAWDPDLQMAVAIKILHRHHDDGDVRERLLVEGRALARVRHPNVVRVLNVEQTDGRFGLVMEYLNGQTLDAMVAASGVLNDREATLIGEDVCRALAAVHAEKIVHRDVKARNILRERSGRIVLMDFGTGLAAESEAAPAAGTPLYMAPEQLRGEKATEAGDIYSTGVLLFYLVSGRYPFDERSVEALRRAQARQQRPSLLDVRPDLPLPFVEVVERALALNPADRYRTPGELLQALAAARDGAPLWKRRLVRGLTFAAIVATTLVLGGMLSSGAFNATLGRGAYATESIGEWFSFGRRSLLVPLVLALLALGFIGLATAIRQIVITASERARGIDRRVMSGCSAVSDRLSLNDPSVCACWILIGTVVVATTILVYWQPLIAAVTSDISTAPAEVLAILSPRFEGYQTYFRMALALLVAANVAAWFRLVRRSDRRGATVPRAMQAAEIAVLVLLIVAMQVPYRLINNDNQFPIVTWRGHECALLGEGVKDALLFCQAMTPRAQPLDKSSESVPPAHGRQNIFAPFATAIP